MPSSHASSTAVSRPRSARVPVLLPLPLAGPYDYRVPGDLCVRAGDFVAVPLGRRTAFGVVWDGKPRGGVAEARLKDIEARLDAPVLPAPTRRFVDWVAAYTVSPPGAVLRMAMSVPEALLAPPRRIAYRRVKEVPALRMTAARRRVLDILAQGPPRGAAELAREAAVGPSVVRGLVEAGALEAVRFDAETPFVPPDWKRPGPCLSSAQRAAAETLAAKTRAGGFSVTLLDGVTGAGKTEVYFEAIAAALEAGRQVLVLLPEIALGAEWLRRFRERFGATPAEWHSELTRAQRRRVWRAVAEGRARVVVGARSALFLPFPELGLIVVDEEHDPSYKQEDGVVYQARDMAVVRGRIEGGTVVLVSATPSLETAINVEEGRYERLHLPARHGGAVLPEIAVVDLRRDPPPRQRWIAPPLERALAATLSAGEQALLFLNRRGYAPLTLCRACGHRLSCPNCTAWLVAHRLAGRLQCHHCGHVAPLPDACPACGIEGRMAACGPGVERLAEEVAALFPEARLAMMTSDTMTGPSSAAELVRRVAGHEIDVLIGTQLVAKGHHFPMLTLVGVVYADLGLSGGDLRAAERTYQLLHQVAGRAGRADRPGRVLLQTCLPEHPVMAALASGARDRFLAEEAAARRRGRWPPYGRLAALIVSGRDGDRVEEAARALGRTAPRVPGVEVLGPAPAPFAVLRGRHRWRLLVKAPKSVNLQRLLSAWRACVRTPRSVVVKIDVDPYSFL